MSTAQDDDVDLLLSLDDRILETPPGSPSTTTPAQPSGQGYDWDDGSPRKRWGAADMSVFRDAVKDYLVDKAPEKGGTGKPGTQADNKPKSSSEIDVEKYSGLRIRKCLILPTELHDYFGDIRFVRLTTIKNLLIGDNIFGCWATAGVLAEKGSPKQSSNGTTFAVWKISALDETTIPVFLFGDAYSNNKNEAVGTVFALMSATIRKDSRGNGFSLTVNTAGQMLKMGKSVDYAICKGKRKDGQPCTMVVNKSRAVYCKFHSVNTARSYYSARTELKGGNLQTAFRKPMNGVYMYNPLKDSLNPVNSRQQVKVLSADHLKRELSKARKVTSNIHSQGIRFLSEVTASPEPTPLKRSAGNFHSVKSSSAKRPFSDTKATYTTNTNAQLDAKRKKTHNTNKVVELDIISSDEE